MLLIGKHIRFSGILLMSIFVLNVTLLSFVAVESDAKLSKLKILKEILKHKHKLKTIAILLSLAKKKFLPKFGILPIPLPLPFP